MELELVRTYFPNGTNGEIYLDGKRICFSIELPWLSNKQNKSCIPEGRYELSKRYSLKFGHHLLVENVKSRKLILLHAANDAMAELRGCIAPVSILKAEGKGLRSRIALEKVMKLAYSALDQKETVFLIIKSNQHEID